MEGFVSRKLSEVLDLLLPVTSFNVVRLDDLRKALFLLVVVEALVVVVDGDEETTGFDDRVFEITEIEDPARNIFSLSVPNFFYYAIPKKSTGY